MSNHQDKVKHDEYLTAEDAYDKYHQDQNLKLEEEKKKREMEFMAKKSEKHIVIQLWEEYEMIRERKKFIAKSNIASKIFNMCVDKIEKDQDVRDSILRRIKNYGELPTNLIWKASPVNSSGDDVCYTLNATGLLDARKLNNGTYASANEIAKNFSENGPFYYEIKNSQFVGYQLVGRGGWMFFPFVRDFNIRLEKIQKPWYKFW